MIDILDDDLSIPSAVTAPVARGLIRMRPYQAEADEKVEANWDQVDERTGEKITRQIVTMATGTGKTPLMGSVARRAFDRGGRVLTLAHTDELIDQARDKFESLLGLPTAKEKAKDRALLDDRIVVGSIQSLCRPARLDSWPKDHFALVQVDECHRSMSASYQRVLSHFCEGGARVLGVTATADRGDKKALGEFYHKLAFDYRLPQAVDDGWLVRLVTRTMDLKIDVTPVKTSATSEGTDLNAGQLSSVLEPMLGEIARAIRAEAGGRKVVVFLPSVDLSIKMSVAMTAAGYRSTWVSGKPHCSDLERVTRQAAYRNGEFDCICNAMLLTEGWDCDDVDCVVILRATQIRALYAQMVGRGTRPLSSIRAALDRAEDKEERKAIIARSPKPYVLVLDPLWLFESHNLALPASLVTDNEELAKQMRNRDGDLMVTKETVEKDFLENLRKALAKNRNRRAATVDPLTFAISIGDEELAAYQPTSLWDMRDPTAEQMRALEGEGIETELVKWRGQAERILNKIIKRREEGLCSVRLMNWLKGRGIDATLYTHDEAVKRQRALMMHFKNRRAGQ